MHQPLCASICCCTSILRNTHACSVKLRQTDGRGHGVKPSNTNVCSQSHTRVGTHVRTPLCPLPPSRVHTCAPFRCCRVPPATAWASACSAAEGASRWCPSRPSSSPASPGWCQMWACCSRRSSWMEGEGGVSTHQHVELLLASSAERTGHARRPF